MNHNDTRVLGRLEEFKEWAKGEFNEIRDEQLKIISKIDQINHARAVEHGKMVIINGIILIVIEIFTKKIIP